MLSGNTTGERAGRRGRKSGSRATFIRCPVLRRVCLMPAQKRLINFRFRDIGSESILGNGET